MKHISGDRMFQRRVYLWACRRLYDEFAWCYDAVAWGVSGGRWAAWRRSALPWIKGQDVLEIGFGTGALLRELTSAGYTATGVDASRAMVRQAKRHWAGRGLGVQARAQALPVAECAFDTVVSTFPAPYIAEAETLAEIARVLRPGGRLVVAGIRVAPARARRRTDMMSGQGELAMRMGAAMGTAGLQLAVTEACVGGAQVGLLVAVRLPRATALEERPG